MASSLPDVDFRRIRPYGQPASRSSAFEELASILIQRGLIEWPEGVRFYRFGNPDGGREGKGVLPNGDVWAWQAKYLFDFDASAAAQLSSSVRRVLGIEPRLRRYLIVLPIDLAAGDSEGRDSAFTRWNNKVAEWQNLAKEEGLQVEFDFVGAHHVVTALTESEHAGRLQYWFGADLLTPNWQRRLLGEAIAKAGRRYTPQVHVEVETVQVLDAVGRVDGYIERWQRVLADLREARQWPWRAPADVAGAFAEALPQAEIALNSVDSALAVVIAAARSGSNLPDVEQPLDDATRALQRLHGLLQEHSLKERRYYVGDAASLYSEIQRALAAVTKGQQLAGSAATRAAREKALLVVGRGGIGKTHLFCDVASRRLAHGRPSILLLGQDFDGRPLLPQLAEQTQLGRTIDDVAAVLDAAAEAAGCIGFLMIDALNESERPERWQDDARALHAVVARWPNIALVVSCRSEFVDGVIGGLSVAQVEHTGFAEATNVAVRRFAREYGLEPPTFPVLNPEFENPLFLKLSCEALATLGATRFPFGTAGLETICRAFLEAVNDRLAQPSRCNYDKVTNPVAAAVREIALLGPDPLDRADVKRITEEALPDRPWSSSLMHGLIVEGVLAEWGDGRVAFGYQRLGDMARAAATAEQPVDEIRAWLRGLRGALWRERGLLGALAVIVPERLGVELIDLAANDDGHVPYDIVEAFLESLLLRAPESTTDRAIEAVSVLLDNTQLDSDVWERLVRISCVPGNRLNAEWLHAQLSGYRLADRDATWSIWLAGALDGDDDSAIGRLIAWGWPRSPQDQTDLPDDVATLGTLLFGWLLTASDRQVRDSATKALVSIGERAPMAFAEALRRFRGVDDPYVVERLAAAACGVALRIEDADATARVAGGLLELVSDRWPLHLLTRDYVRRVFAAARARGWSGPHALPPYGSEWPVSTRNYDEIKALAERPHGSYGSIWHSITGWGDFGRYVLQPALRHFVTQDSKALRHDAERAVFDRVLELGWTPDRFGAFDQGRYRTREGPIERIGKKYQWIALYEVLGRIADNHEVKTSWGDVEPAPYRYAEEIVWRDIDPSVIVRPFVEGTTRLGRPWFSPAEATFPTDTNQDYPSDTSGVPDPLDVIAVSDAGAPWLVLVSDPKWEQPVPLEMEALRLPRRVVWMQVHASLVPAPRTTQLTEWARTKDWYEGRMPEIADIHNVLLGAHPGAPEWSLADGRVEWWDTRMSGSKPPELLEAAAWYGGTGSSRDESAEEETRGHVPSRPLFDALGLSPGRDFVWSDAAGVAVYDPSAAGGGPAALVMRRDLMARLLAAGFAIFWTVLIGSELRRPDWTSAGDDYRWVTASASYLLSDERIELIAARARRCKPGPRTERDVWWEPRPAEA